MIHEDDVIKDRLSAHDISEMRCVLHSYSISGLLSTTKCYSGFLLLFHAGTLMDVLYLTVARFHISRVVDGCLQLLPWLFASTFAYDHLRQ